MTCGQVDADFTQNNAEPPDETQIIGVLRGGAGRVRAPWPREKGRIASLAVAAAFPEPLGCGFNTLTT